MVFSPSEIIAEILSCEDFTAVQPSGSDMDKLLSIYEKEGGEDKEVVGR